MCFGTDYPLLLVTVSINSQNEGNRLPTETPRTAFKNPKVLLELPIGKSVEANRTLHYSKHQPTNKLFVFLDEILLIFVTIVSVIVVVEKKCE
jgi:hypothetical protein